MPSLSPSFPGGTGAFFPQPGESYHGPGQGIDEKADEQYLGRINGSEYRPTTFMTTAASYHAFLQERLVMTETLLPTKMHIMMHVNVSVFLVLDLIVMIH